MDKSLITFRGKTTVETNLVTTGIAADSIGKLEKNSCTLVLTYGQFSLIDALCVIINTVGPATMTICSWTFIDPHLMRLWDLVETGRLKKVRFITDGSFFSRQPETCQLIDRIFGKKTLRATKTHAKFTLIRSKTHDLSVISSMNLNRNPRLETLEIFEDRKMAEFFQAVTDSIFSEVDPDDHRQKLPGLSELKRLAVFKQIRAKSIKRANVARYTHTV